MIDTTTHLPLNPCRLRAAGILAFLALTLSLLHAHPGHERDVKHSPSTFSRTHSGEVQVNLITLEKDGIRISLTCDQIESATAAGIHPLKPILSSSEVVLTTTSLPAPLSRDLHPKFTLLPSDAPHNSAMASVHHHAARGTHFFTILLPEKSARVFEVQLMNQGFSRKSTSWITLKPAPPSPQ